MSDAPETIWATMPTDRILKSETLYGWQVTESTDGWDQEDDYDDPCELVEYRRADLPPTTAQLEADPRVKALVEALGECQTELDDYSRQEYPSDHPVHERYRQRDYDANPARIALAQLKEPKE